MDFTPAEIRYLLDLAHDLKAKKRLGIKGKSLEGKNIVLLFEKTSTRTRCSFEVAAMDEGAGVTFLDSKSSQMGKKESIADTAKVLGRMFDGIEYRGYEQAVVEELAAEAGVPVWNGLTDIDHPTQILADLLTIEEHVAKPLSKVKVVILGQDPYHEPGQAHGLAFSVQPGVPKPPSLINIFQELRDDLGIPEPVNGTLTKWAQEGVLLLNTALTVREHQANSHHGKGWEILTDRIIELLGSREKPMVFMLWGNNARSKRDLIDRTKHLVMEAPHPSPLSAHRGFFGGRYFSRANAFLEEPVDWRL